jgi:hypothetical protein
MIRSLFEIARKAGAERKRLVLGDVSLDLRGEGSEEVFLFAPALMVERGAVHLSPGQRFGVSPAEGSYFLP